MAVHAIGTENMAAGKAKDVAGCNLIEANGAFNLGVALSLSSAAVHFKVLLRLRIVRTGQQNTQDLIHEALGLPCFRLLLARLSQGLGI
jgi:hypothetical protein